MRNMSHLMNGLREMAYARMASVALPGQRFFTPLPEFWDRLNEVAPAGVQLVDTGCGRGDLLGEAEAMGRELIGIDVASRTGQDSRVLMRNAITYPWSAATWPMLCRPSHDGWAAEVMKVARQAGAIVLYVGLPKNYRQDLGRVRSVNHGIVGAEGERLYVIAPYRPRMEKP